MKANHDDLIDIVKQIDKAYRDEFTGNKPINSAIENSVALIAKFLVDQMPVSRQREYTLQLGFDTAPKVAEEIGITRQYFYRIKNHYRSITVGSQTFYTRKILKPSNVTDAH